MIRQYLPYFNQSGCVFSYETPEFNSVCVVCVNTVKLTLVYLPVLYPQDHSQPSGRQPCPRTPAPHSDLNMSIKRRKYWTNILLATLLLVFLQLNPCQFFLICIYLNHIKRAKISKKENTKRYIVLRLPFQYII